MPDVGGGRDIIALAGEVIHVRIGTTAEAPWRGSAPLNRASLTAGMLHALESALGDIYATAPLGSQVVPFPESSEAGTTSVRAHSVGNMAGCCCASPWPPRQPAGQRHKRIGDRPTCRVICPGA